MIHTGIRVDYPSWVDGKIDWERRYDSDEDKMRLAIAVAQCNVLEDTGGPFGAAIFEQVSGRLVSVGMNMVIPQNNCVLHGEIVAFMMAQARIGSFTLGASELPVHVLASSCEPCAMCLGATLWSGVKRVICGAKREDAEVLQFEEGPVFAESYVYLAERGIEFRHEVCRKEAAAVLDQYVRRSGRVYNG